MRRGTFAQILMTTLMLVLGILIVAQFRARGRLRAVASSRDEQTMLLSELADANRRLRAELEALRAQQATYAKDGATAGLEELVAELNRVRVLNGQVEVSGPGLELILDGPLNALDLQDLMNELYNAGAEAVSLDGHRIVVNSVVVVDRNGQMLVDGQPAVRPHRLLAIGDADAMATALHRPGGLLAVLRRAYPNLIAQTREQPKLVIGVLRVQRPHQYAQPAG